MRVLLIFLLLLSIDLEASKARLSVCIHHKSASIEGFESQNVAQWIIPQKAKDKGSGVFGHVWLWIEPPSEVDGSSFEIGHTGELDSSKPTYLENFCKISQQTWGEPISIFFEDRQDGARHIGNGGHLPDEVWSLELTPLEYEHLMQWIQKGYYDFHRYNLGLHQCCHFALEALQSLGIKLQEPLPVRLPKKIVIWGTSFQVWRDPRWSELFLWTPFALARSLEQDGRFKESKQKYLARCQQSYSLNPLIRFWQKREEATRLVRFSFEQVKRHVWVWGWQVKDDLTSLNSKPEAPLPKTEPMHLN